MAGVHAMMISGGGGSGGGIVYGNGVYLKPNGITIAAVPNAAKGTWHTFEGKDFYVVKDSADLTSVVGVYKGLSGSGEVFADLTRDGQTKSIPLNHVVTSFVTSTYSLFYETIRFNQDISAWDTSNVTNMGYMLFHCNAFNQDISAWDTSNVTNMNSMFDACLVFNQPIGSWDTSNVTDMKYIFRDCRAFVQDISGWCVFKIKTAPSVYAIRTNTAWTAAMKPKWGAPC